MDFSKLTGAIEGNYHVVFFKNDTTGTSLQTLMMDRFFTEQNFYDGVDLVVGSKIKIPHSRDWYTVADVFVSEKIKTVFVACEYIFEDDLDA